MQSINRIGRTLLVVSALGLPSLALAEPPADSAPKSAETPKKDKDAAHKHAAKAHKPDEKPNGHHETTAPAPK